MTRARLMDRPADYEKLGVNPDHVEPWEDGRRHDGRSGHFEWWYFDAICDDGTKLVAAFYPKHREKVANDGDVPSFQGWITPPEGGDPIIVTRDHSSDDVTFATDHCQVQMGKDSFTGDLKNYHVVVDPADGNGFDVTLTSQSTPWRPGTGYFAFGDDDENYFTWLCVVPKGEISGTVTIDGQTRQVHGFGYHDHQWGTLLHPFAWNSWIWARQNIGEYTITLFDLVMNRNFDFRHYPLAFIQDGQGRVLFSNTTDEDTTVDVLEEYHQDQVDRDYPKRIRYTIGNDGSTFEYTLTAEQELEIVDVYSSAPEPARAQFDKLQLHPTYTRWAGQADTHLTRPDGSHLNQSGELLYEMSYNGISYKEHE